MSYSQNEKKEGETDGVALETDGDVKTMEGESEKSELRQDSRRIGLLDAVAALSLAVGRAVVVVVMVGRAGRVWDTLGDGDGLGDGVLVGGGAADGDGECEEGRNESGDSEHC